MNTIYLLLIIAALSTIFAYAVAVTRSRAFRIYRAIKRRGVEQVRIGDKTVNRYGAFQGIYGLELPIASIMSHLRSSAWRPWAPTYKLGTEPSRSASSLVLRMQEIATADGII